jgi:hypothetical protein
MNVLQRTPVDRRSHSQATSRRTERRSTKGIVLHRITYQGTPGVKQTGVEGVIEFWLTQPWGVATTTIEDDSERMEKVIEWTKRGTVPLGEREKSFVPYHALIDEDGVVHQMLDWNVAGAHAYPNSKLVGLGFIGDFRIAPPTAAAIQAGKETVRDLMVAFGPDAVPMTHDLAKLRFGKTIRARKPKGCPGALFPFEEIASWATTAAGHVAIGRERS